MNKNPKEARAKADKKAPMEHLVFSVLEEDAKCHKHGADKYGRLNWRSADVKASTYVGAIMRHLMAFEAGQDVDPDSGLSHLTHIRACCAVVLDSKKQGSLIDDRGRVEVISENNNTGE